MEAEASDSARAAGAEGSAAGDSSSPQQTPLKLDKRGSGPDGLEDSNLPMLRKRKVVDGEEEEDRDRQHASDQDEDAEGACESSFLAVPDGVHRDIAALLEPDDIGQVASSCRRLGPLYLTGFKHMRLCSFMYWEGAERAAMEDSFPKFVARLTALETFDTSTLGLKLLINAASAGPAATAPWMLTLRKVQVGMPMYEYGWEKHGEKKEETEEEQQADEHPAAERRHGRDEVLSAFLDLLGRGLWPRLQHLKFISPVTSLEAHVKELATALAARGGGGCDRLQALEIDWFENDTTATLTDEGAMRQLLSSSECCQALQTFRVGAKAMLSPGCFNVLVEFVTSPHGQQLEVLHCRSNPSRVQQDPHLITALAEGCLPNLRELEVTYLMPEVDVSPEASAALYSWAAGPFSKKLEVFKCRAWPGLFEPLMEGVRAGHGFSKVYGLTLLFTTYAAGLLDELCRAMEGGAMPRLKTIVLQNFDGAGLVRLMESLSGGRSPCSATLAALAVAYCSASDEEGEAVGRALATGACPRLWHLTLTKSRGVGDRTVEAIADAVRAGAADRLRNLYLAKTSVGDEGLTALKSAMLEREASALSDVTFTGCNVSGGRTKLVAYSWKKPKLVIER